MRFTQTYKYLFVVAALFMANLLQAQTCSDEGINDCTPQPLLASSVCSPDFATLRAWKTSNPNPTDTLFTATIKETVTSGLVAGFNAFYNIPIKAGETVELTSPAAAGDTLQVWENFHCDPDVEAITIKCDCLGVPGGSAVVDKCGICAGDGSTCDEPQCITEDPTPVEIKTSRDVLKSAKVIVDRTKMFADKSRPCSGKNYPDYIARALKYYAQVKRLLKNNITYIEEVCTNSICTRVSTKEIKARLNSLTEKLYLNQRDMKYIYIKVCKIPDIKDPNDHRKNSLDYRNDMLDSVKKLPKTNVTCTELDS